MKRELKYYETPKRLMKYLKKITNRRIRHNKDYRVGKKILNKRPEWFDRYW